MDVQNPDAYNRQLILEAIALETSDLVDAKDLQGRYVFYNRTGAALFGKSLDEMLGRTNAELFGPDLTARLAIQDEQVLSLQQEM